MKLTRKEDCCGCNACGDVCPKGAIHYTTDEEGFWYPQIDSEKCINCGLCDKVCPMEHTSECSKGNTDKPICYAANHKNLQIRFDSTSGGMFTALAEPFLKSGGYVGGAVYTETWGVKQIVTNQPEDLEKLRSSKYIQSDATGFYRKIKELLDGGEKVLAVGLPCQMAALKCFLGRDYENLLIVDLICLYINSPMAYRKYLDYLEREYKSKVVYIKAKNKELGWRQLTHKVVFKNGATYYGTIQVDRFMRASMGNKCLSRPACYACRFKGFPRHADISIGDYWTKGRAHTLDDDTGTSVVLLNSEKGKAYFESVRKKLQCAEVSFDSVVQGNPALMQPLARGTVDRKVFYDRLRQEPFDVVVDSMCPIGKDSLKHQIKTLLKVAKRELQTSRGHPVPLLQFIYLNFMHPAVHSHLLKGHVIYTSPHCIFEIHRKASVELNGYLLFGHRPFKRSKLETRIRMAEGSRLVIGNLSTGGYAFGYGSDIELFKNAVLESKGGPSTNMNTTIICMNRIVIGQMVAIGRNVTIRDNNGGHLININGYRDSLPVFIGEHVWLCEGSMVMGGVKIGDGTIVGAGSIVKRSLPPHVIASGNPATTGMEGIEWKM